MTNAHEIAEALPDFKKADALLDAYLRERAKTLGKFRPENYFNNTKARFINVKTANIRDVSKALCKKKNEPYFREFADFLWNSGVFEKMSIAAEAYAYCDLSFEDFSEIVKNIDNWAHCDSFCARVSGPYFQNQPTKIPELMRFAKSRNPWERRFACVSLISILRDKSANHVDALRILDILVPDKDRKIVGAAVDWMMREYVKKNYDEGFAFMKKWAKKPATRTFIGCSCERGTS
ncbi:MAG: DNA alkylation repair protein [archaeon]